MTIIKKPTCYVFAGPNGAGKTTFALRYLPEVANCRNFVNADLIAYGISPLDVTAVEVYAGKVFLSEVNKYVEKRVDFGFETTLAGRGYIKLINQLKASGWQVVMFFLWIPDAEFSKERVGRRVLEGGNDIPAEIIYRRYPRIMFNLKNVYAGLCDSIYCYDNSGPVPTSIFIKESKRTEIINNDIYEKITRCTNE